MLQKIRSAAANRALPSWSIPAALLGLAVLAYGLRALSLGFFWDDWPYLWLFDRFGVPGIVTAFSSDRPFLSFIYSVSLTVLGSSRQGWQIFALLAHWLCAVAFWRVLTEAWPRHIVQAGWAAMLFVVYPGFTQHWIAVIYGQAFLLWALALFSIALTLRLFARPPASRAAQIGGTILALVMGGLTTFSTEYFFGLELLRPVLLWLMAANIAGEGLFAPRASLWKRLVRVLRVWLPYLLLLIAFAVWRAQNAFKSFRVIEKAEQSPLDALRTLALFIVEDLVEASLAAWGQVLQVGGWIERGANDGLQWLVLVLLTALVYWLYLALLNRGRVRAAEPRRLNWAGQAALVGIIALLVSGWPFWITALPVRLGFPWDRYTLPMSVGVCLLIAAAIDGLVRSTGGKAAVLALCLGLAVGFHFNVSATYRSDWTAMRDLFWQLSWRAPAVQPNTIFLTDSIGLRYYEDDSLTAPLNWMYDPDNPDRVMHYPLLDYMTRRFSLPRLVPDQPVEREYRGVTFQGNTSQMLLLYYEPPGCVKILDPGYDTLLPGVPDVLVRAMNLSNPGAWIGESPTPAQPPAAIFGNEPRHRWCYYFEKAELARQNEDWETVAVLSQEAVGVGLQPQVPAEYLPMIEGLARTGRIDDAYQMTVRAEKEDAAIRPAVCAIWQRSTAPLPSGQPPTRLDEIHDLLHQNMNCPSRP